VPTNGSCTGNSQCCLGIDTTLSNSDTCSQGKCCGNTEMATHQRYASCHGDSDCCDGMTCIPGYGNGTTGGCCLDFQQPCTTDGAGYSDCCAGGNPITNVCNSHLAFSGTRCCIPDGVGSAPCSAQACCSGYCDTTAGFCCKPQGQACVAGSLSGCCSGTSCKGGTCQP
jgi:hypothetical protein